METFTETLKNGATSDVENYAQVTIAHDNQQKLIKDTLKKKYMVTAGLQARSTSSVVRRSNLLVSQNKSATSACSICMKRGSIMKWCWNQTTNHDEVDSLVCSWTRG